MTEKIRAAIIGSTGYGGVELIRLLLRHPHVEITSVISSSTAGEPITAGFPHLAELLPMDLDGIDIPLIKSKADVVFTATPHGVSTAIVPELLEAGLKVVDLSGDFRLKSGDVYREWYKKEPAPSAYLEQAVYGLAEVFGEEVAGKVFVSNPGCFPTATLLGLIPALAAGLIQPNSIIIDAKSGVSGAGRGLSLSSHYAEVNENFKAYKINQHQHTPEIEQVLGEVAGQPVIVTFTTHLVPMTRGILCTMYAQLTDKLTVEDFISCYQSYYKGRPFVRIRRKGNWPATKEVTGSNYCDIGFAVDERTGRVTIISVIDNLMKGAAGQAVQNLNLMMGWDEALGLDVYPVYP
ncbi:MAG: N-acetyl-gamma-glutamyl-phosphate reductase [Gorillibacterium sp.]|nr:N-acetyl-gamma-glutamyl-phosphate reductase [Gorillibacterium sp.]